MRTTRPKILLVDDDSKLLGLMADRVRLKGFDSLTARSGAEAVAIVRDTPVEIAIVDYTMPGMDGIVTITRLKAMIPGLKTVLLTGYGNEKLREAAEGIRSYYFEKDQMAKFWRLIRQYAPSESDMAAISQEITEDTDTRSRSKVAPTPTAPTPHLPAPVPALTTPPISQIYDAARRGHGAGSHPLIGASPAIMAIRRDIRKVAFLDCPVLIQGEQGTGKELVARSIHAASPRKENLFIAVNCGSFDHDLLQTELFGKGSGSDADAQARKTGVFETAFGGTILLGEVNETPLPIQVQLAEIFRKQIIYRTNGSTPVPVNVRILGATRKSLEPAADSGRFREDLFRYFNTFLINLPPLRERSGDIPLLSHYFKERYVKRFNKPVRRISDRFISALEGHSFPENVQELKTIIERAVILCEGDTLTEAHLPPDITANPEPPPEDESGFLTLSELERRYILKVLSALKGKKSETAKVLGITRGSLWRKLKQFGKS